MIKQAHLFARLFAVVLTSAGAVSCGGDGGLTATITDLGGASISASKLTSNQVLAQLAVGPVSHLILQDATTKDLDINPHCIDFDVAVCGVDFEKREYEVVPFRHALLDACEEGTGWITISEAGPDCVGETREWTPSSGSIVVESIADGEIHLRFDANMQPTPETFKNMAEGVFRVVGTMWADHP